MNKRKIYIIDECIDRVGGVERVICTLANKLVKNNEVTIISENKSRVEPFYNYDKKVNIRYLDDKFIIKSSSLKNKNLIYYFYKIIEKINKKFIINYKIKKVVKEMGNADVVIFGRVFTALDFLKYMNKKNNTKIIVRDAINLEYYSKNTRKKIKKYFKNKIDYLIASSDESINIYKEFFCDSEINILKIYNPLGIVPKKRFAYNNKMIVSIGRLDVQKGFDYLIEAFSIVIKKHKDWKLEIYGDGNEKDRLLSLITELHLENNVSILPSNKEVVNILNNSSIFVLPSRYEGYANILVESLACGVPSISYNWMTGVEEIIENNKTGIIVNLQNRIDYFYNRNKNIKDIINLGNSINYLIENEKICNKISNESVKIINTRDSDLIIKQWLDII